MFNTYRFSLAALLVSKETIKFLYLKNSLNKPKAKRWRAKALHFNKRRSKTIISFGRALILV